MVLPCACLYNSPLYGHLPRALRGTQLAPLDLRGARSITTGRLGGAAVGVGRDHIFPWMELKYKRSTFFLAQGVFLKNVKLDLMLGLSVKHLMAICFPSSSQPYCSTRRIRIISSVRPCRGSLDGLSLIVSP